MLNRFFKFISSLKLTIVCLSISLVLIFMGTLAQQNLDAFYAQKKYFDTMFVWWTPHDKDLSIPVFPGGYLIGGVLLVNLLAAHAVRFKLSWKKTGILLAHSGIILLLVGGLYTALWSRDTRMTIAQGSTVNYTESFKDFELVIIDKSAPDRDTVVSIPESFLAAKETVSSPALPFRVKVVEYYPNSDLTKRQPGEPPQLADKGMLAAQFDVVPQALTTRPDEENHPAAFVQLVSPAGPLGTWLLWATPFGVPVPATTAVVDGKTFELQLRPKRYYKPYDIHLNHLTHEIYAGTDIPKNFASQIHLSDPGSSENRDALIYMNHPLRYHGETFYQYQTLGADDKYSVFEVVKNPSWWLPYLSCAMVGAGLVVQFGMHLVNFLKRRLA